MRPWKELMAEPKWVGLVKNQMKQVKNEMKPDNLTAIFIAPPLRHIKSIRSISYCDNQKEIINIISET